MTINEILIFAKILAFVSGDRTVIVTDLQQWHGYIRPYQDECEKVPQPETKEELVETSRILGIDWEIDEILDPKEHDLGWW